jgi:hypothetical protein
MFIGHFAVALAAKRAAPEVSLGTLVMAAQLADLAWPVFVLLGWESFRIAPGFTAVTPFEFLHYPYSHSLVALALWGTALGGAYYALRRRAWAAAIVLAVVLSHWLLDAASHAPDMPLTIGGTGRVGLGLWNSLPATLAVEGALFAAGLALYARATRPIDRAGRWSLAGFIVFLLVLYVAAVFGPPPPNVDAVAWSGLGIWLLVAWGYWIDRHRKVADA